MTVLQEVQKKLACAIQNSGLKQKDIATRLDVSQQTISHYMKGDKMPSLDTFAKLCAVLDLDANDILCIERIKKNEEQ